MLTNTNAQDYEQEQIAKASNEIDLITGSGRDSLTEAQIVNLINSKIEENKQIIELDYVTRTSYTAEADNETITIPFTQTNKVGNKLSFSNNGVLVGSGVSKVKVSYSYNVEALNSTCGYFRGKVYINSSSTDKHDTVNSTQYLMNLAKTCILEVNEGDLITGKIIARNPGSFYTFGCTMVVEVIN